MTVSKHPTPRRRPPKAQGEIGLSAQIQGDVRVPCLFMPLPLSTFHFQ